MTIESWQSRFYQDNFHDNQADAIMDFFMVSLRYFAWQSRWQSRYNHDILHGKQAGSRTTIMTFCMTIKLAVSLQSWHFYDNWAVSLITIMTFWWQLSCQSHYNHKICMAIKLAFSLQSWHCPWSSSWQSHYNHDIFPNNRAGSLVPIRTISMTIKLMLSWIFSWQSSWQTHYNHEIFHGKSSWQSRCYHG